VLIFASINYMKRTSTLLQHMQRGTGTTVQTGLSLRGFMVMLVSTCIKPITAQVPHESKNRTPYSCP